MKERTLLVIAVGCAVTGVLALYLISSRIEIEESDINKIMSGTSEESVLVSGNIARVTETEKAVMVDIIKQETVTVVLFRKEDEHFTLNKGDRVEVRGRTDEYKGKVEVIAEEVRIVG